MPSFPIQLKRNGTAAATPSSLLHGEVALNYADGKLFWKDASNVIQSFTFQAYALSSHTHAASDVTSGTLDAARLPLATTIAAGAVIVGTGLGVSSGTVSVTYGTNSTSACRGDDSRLSDTRTPTDGSVTTAKLANDAVTYAKLQNVSATDRLLGRSSAGAGDVEEITCTAFGRSLIDDADAASARSTLSVQPTASPAFTGAATFTAASGGSSVPVTITNEGTGNSFVVNDAPATDSTPFVIDASGNVGVGGSPSAIAKVHVLGDLPASASTQGFRMTGEIPSAATVTATSYISFPSTQASSFTLGSLFHYRAFQGTFGAGSAVTSQFGYHADASLTGATNNYGFYSDIASGTGRWNFYANGTAANYFAGQLLVTAGSGTGPSSYVPGLAISGDPDTGLQQVGGANTISIVTQGSERVRVDASGNVGIGKAPNAKLHVNTGTDKNLYITSGIRLSGSALQSIQDNNATDSPFEIYTQAQVQIEGNPITFYNNGEVVRVTSGGEVLIGTTNDNGAYKLQVNSQIYATNATIATSDARFKKNVESLTDATAVIEALRPVAFDFIPHAERNFATERQVGLIAQEAQAALAGTDYADSVVAQCGDHLGLAYEKLVPVLIKALQESNARIAALEERLNHA